MSQGNQFYQYGYDHYLKAPQRKPQQKRSGPLGAIKAKMRSPLVATIALLCAGGVFASVIISAYPSKEDEQVQVPIVKADLRPMRVAPEEPGGMLIPHRDSTVLAEIGQAETIEMQQNNEKIENLFAAMPHDRDMMTKDEAIMQASQMAQEQEVAVSMMAAGDISASDLDVVDPYQAKGSIETEEELAMKITDGKAPELLPETVMSSVDAPIVSSPDSTSSSNSQASLLLQKIGGTHDTQANEAVENSEFVAEVAKAAMEVKPQTEKAVVAKVAPAPKTTMHAPATSPETLDFVRSVLKEEPVEQPKNIMAEATPIKAVKPEVVEPSAGAAAPVQAVATGGQYFVQLASITDAQRAKGEFEKMQSKYNALVRWDYRVQEASLSSGKFYRIQAGPMSKVDAERVCSALKAQGKPGGCLVVK